jgi:hypothetical protein
LRDAEPLRDYLRRAAAHAAAMFMMNRYAADALFLSAISSPPPAPRFHAAIALLFLRVRHAFHAAC